jgi:hypothetical protein
MRNGCGFPGKFRHGDFFHHCERIRYAILGAPIIIAADIRVMEKWAIDLYTAAEVHTPGGSSNAQTA